MDMLKDLYLLGTYFEESFSAIHEADLIQRYGRAETRAAIYGGYLDHARIPCGRGDIRCVCRLSQKGREAARNDMRLP